MKPVPAKICFIISSAAVLFLMVTSDRVVPLVTCLGVVVLLALLIAKSKDPLFLTDPRSVFSNQRYLFVSLLIGGVLGITSYITWINSAAIQQFAAFLGIPAKLIVAPLLLVCILAAIPCVATLLFDFAATVKNDYKEAPCLVSSGRPAFSAGRSFAIVAALYLVGISSMIRANYAYGDDRWRAFEGLRNWENFSRFLNNSLSTLIHTSLHITDITPLTQGLAILIVALAGVLLLYVVYGRKTFSLWELVALLPLAINPYFLHCFSFKFDSPFMALSILAAVAPLLLRNSTPWKYVLAIVLGMLVLCTTYQASCGIFPMAVVLLCFRMWAQNKPGKEILHFLASSVAGFGIGLGIFRLILMLPFTDDYVSSSLPPIGEFFPTLCNNFARYISLILSDHTTVSLAVILLLVIAFWVAACIASVQKKLPTLCLAVLTTVLMFLLCFGPFPAFEIPSFDARSMYGFAGAMVTLLGISTAEDLQPVALRIPAVVIAWMFFVFSFVYGNALDAQKEYANFRLSQVLCDLNHMEEFLGDEPVTIQFDGAIGQAPLVTQMAAKYPVLDRIIFDPFTGYYKTQGIIKYYGLRNAVEDSSIDLTTLDLPLVKDTMYHALYSDGEHVLIEFK